MDAHGSPVTALSTQLAASACSDGRAAILLVMCPPQVMDQLAVHIGQALRLNP
jgi:hypothetical protein